MSTLMTRKGFEKYTQIYGSSLEHWPDSIRDAAGHFQQRHPADANRILQEERPLDQLLTQTPVLKASARLQARVMSTFPAAQHQSEHKKFAITSWLINGILMQNNAIPAWSIILTVMLVSGFVGGYSGYAHTLNQTGATEIIADAFGAEDSAFLTEETST